MSATLRNTKANKLLAPVIAYADANGWEIERTGGGHLRYKKPNRQPVHSSSTPSCPFAPRKIVAELTRQDRARQANN